MAKAMSLGMTVCRPFGENHRFDFLVFAPGKKGFRVQVKSSWVKSGGTYRFKISGCNGRQYRKGEVDFIVAYIVPHDAWYVIPRYALAPHHIGSVSPHVRNSRTRWERYREAWGLLRGEVPGYGIELQACADEQSSVVSRQSAAERQTTEDTEDAEKMASGDRGIAGIGGTESSPAAAEAACSGAA